ncbi:MAG: hypothetical protein CMI36_07550 [Owenweeksia sp.]|mgnify:CR=1 FL=1|nr:hypothetical protein [Owenweeksia sp.]MBF98829.1 hypothetical protein [Owenweeksia sp.]HCQ16192.1 hypothetical protein [Cryomorphaceae bacterium]|tara:strand:+ start:3027 stop:4013 length:987 start_codon:yes stop_codon:yes gene_type:complete
MKKIMLNLSLALATGAMLLTSGCSKDDDDNKNTGPGNALAVMKADEDLSLFAEAAEKVGLGGTLSGGAQITVFAPSNTVFKAYLTDLSFNDIDGMISVRGEAAVKQMLSYHILEGKFTAEELSKGYSKTKATNSEGDAMDVFINTTGSVTVNGSNGALVTTPDIEASNGVIHKTTGVLQPMTISGLLAVNNDFSILAEASAKASGDILAVLNQEQSNFTVMAPNNTAFNSFFAGSSTISSVDDMVIAFGTQGLQDLLDYHVILGYKRTDDLSTGTYPTRLNGESQSITNAGGNITITDGQGNQANIVFRDITALNGTINTITTVLQDD